MTLPWQLDGEWFTGNASFLMWETSNSQAIWQVSATFFGKGDTTVRWIAVAPQVHKQVVMAMGCPVCLIPLGQACQILHMD